MKADQRSGRGGGKPRPGPLWMFFYGRRRRGFPGLLAALVALVVSLALLFRYREGVEVSRWIGLVPIVIVALLLLLALVVIVLGLLRPRERR